jgi:hypothetical protein
VVLCVFVRFVSDFVCVGFVCGFVCVVLCVRAILCVRV